MRMRENISSKERLESIATLLVKAISLQASGCEQHCGTGPDNPGRDPTQPAADNMCGAGEK